MCQLETLRLFPPVVSVPESTAESGASVTYQNHRFPPDMPINLSITGLHYAEEYWGSDATSFNPSRWDRRNPDSVLAANEGTDGLSGSGLEYGTIHKPVRGSFIPFSDGVRAYMGKKFS